MHRSNGSALYEQVTEALAAAIASGELASGARLPSERDLAASLGISRTTAVNAYRELAARGLVRGHVGRGTFVCAGNGPEPAGAPFAWRGKVALSARRSLDQSLRAIVRAASDPALISFAAGAPALDIFPIAVFRELTDSVLRRHPTAALGLAPTEGQPDLRRAIAARHRVRPEQVLVVAGAQQGLDLIAHCLIDPGDVVILDRPGYLGAIQVFRAAGANLIGWDAERGDLEELEDLLLRYRPKLLCTTPTLQNPTGRTSSAIQRRELLALAARYRLPIVEDEPYRDLWFDRPPPPTLLNLDHSESVIHIGTFSKTLAGGLRLGWVAANEAIVEQLATIKQRGDVSTASLSQLVVADFLRSPHHDRHLAALRIEHKRRHDLMLAAIRHHLPPGALTCAPVQGGLYLWCRLAPGLDARELLQAATAAGVLFVTGDLCYPDGNGAHELRLCFSCAPPTAIEEGVRRLRNVIRDLLRTRRAVTASSPMV
ncbi:MAG: PLP-dependent aminotransferase family protein [Thermomicrobiales bacterium]